MYYNKGLFYLRGKIDCNFFLPKPHSEILWRWTILAPQEGHCLSADLMHGRVY